MAERRLPDFIGIGAMRCGTTWLAAMLREHPQIFVPAHFKELFFFDRYFEKGTDWYVSNFDGRSEDQIAGEFTPTYMRERETLQRIARTCPEAKLILSLRDPIKRAMSHYTFLKNRRSLTSNFHDALFDERFQILKTGLFGEQLEYCLSLFPEKNIHVVIHDDIRNDPRDVLRELYGFLEVDDDFIPADMSAEVNARHAVRFKLFALTIQRLKLFLRSFVRSRELLVKLGFFKLGRGLNKLNAKPAETVEMTPETREILKDYYRQDLQLLNKLLKGRVAHWL